MCFRHTWLSTSYMARSKRICRLIASALSVSSLASATLVSRTPFRLPRASSEVCSWWDIPHRPELNSEFLQATDRDPPRPARAAQWIVRSTEPTGCRCALIFAKESAERRVGARRAEHEQPAENDGPGRTDRSTALPVEISQRRARV